ncbi:MAG: hypothetical protein AB1782_06770 [Cyanobacteriota bacterium]
MIINNLNNFHVKPVCNKKTNCCRHLTRDTITFSSAVNNIENLKVERDNLVKQLKESENLSEKDINNLRQIKKLHISFLPRDASSLAYGEYSCPNNAAVVIVDKIVETLTRKDKLHQKAMQSFLDYYQRTKKHKWLFNLTSKICSSLEISNDKTLAFMAAEKLLICEQKPIRRLLELELEINKEKILKNTNAGFYKQALEAIIKGAAQ